LLCLDVEGYPLSCVILNGHSCNTAHYTSHHCLLETFDSHRISSYFHYSLATDNSYEHNIQAVQNGQLLLNGNRVEACNVAVHNIDVYFTGMVRAVMKKKVY